MPKQKSVTTSIRNLSFRITNPVMKTNENLELEITVPSTLREEKFENTALFLWLGLPSTLIRHENEAFRNRSSNQRNLRTLAFRFRVDENNFKNGAFRKRRRSHDNRVISRVAMVIAAFLNLSGTVWTHFRSENTVSEFLLMSD